MTEAQTQEDYHKDYNGNNRGVSRSTTGLVDWKRQRSVDFTCYWAANSNDVSSLSIRCLVLIFFSSDFFWFAARNTISTAIMRKIFFYQVYTNLAYVPPTYRRVKKLQVCMINKNVRKSLARKKGNNILIQSWNDSPTCYTDYSRNITQYVAYIPT